ncbi:hypothetical protein JCM10296v2_004852 [Rhodotorula toruloides]
MRKEVSVVLPVLNAGLAEQAARAHEARGSPETKLGKDGVGGWFEFLAKQTGKVPSADEVPIQEPDCAHSILLIIVALIIAHPGCVVQLISPAVGVALLRILIGLLEDAFKAGLILILGFCVTEGEQYLDEYMACVDTVRKWGYKGNLYIYMYPQENALSSPHRKGFQLKAQGPTYISASTTANLTDRGTAAAKHFAPTAEAACDAPGSAETIDISTFDLRNPDQAGWKEMQKWHARNQRIARIGGFVWATEVLRDDVIRKHKVERPVEDFDEEEYAQEVIKEIQTILEEPTHPDNDVDAYAKQVAFLSASSARSGGGGGGPSKRKKMRSQIPLATNEQRKRIEEIASEARSLTKRPRPDKATQQQKKQVAGAKFSGEEEAEAPPSSPASTSRDSSAYQVPHPRWTPAEEAFLRDSRYDEISKKVGHLDCRRPVARCPSPSAPLDRH